MCPVCGAVTLFTRFTMDVGICIGRHYSSCIAGRRCTVSISIAYQRLWCSKRHPYIDCMYFYHFHIIRCDREMKLICNMLIVDVLLDYDGSIVDFQFELETTISCHSNIQ